MNILQSFEEFPANSDYDFIISSVPNSEAIAGCIFIDVLFTPFNRRQIKKEIMKYIKKQKELAFRHHILPYFDPELFSATIRSAMEKKFFLC